MASLQRGADHSPNLDFADVSQGSADHLTLVEDSVDKRAAGTGKSTIMAGVLAAWDASVRKIGHGGVRTIQRSAIRQGLTIGIGMLREFTGPVQARDWWTCVSQVQGMMAPWTPGGMDGGCRFGSVASASMRGELGPRPLPAEPAQIQRRNWPRWSLEKHYGADENVALSWDDLDTGLSDFVARLDRLHERARDRAAGNPAAESAASALNGFAIPRPALVSHPMRVVLMGRTQAGKSTLLAALTGNHSERIGDGRQRFSRDVLAAPMSGLPDVELVDTPGVGARDGQEDYDVAMTAVLDADLVLWVTSNDSFQEETAKALRVVAVSGKPVLVVLNCRKALRSEFDIDDFLDYPETVFGQQEGNFQRVRAHLAAAGVAPIAEVAIHASAAHEALKCGYRSSELASASSLRELLAEIDCEKSRGREARRTLRLVDDVRRPGVALGEGLRESAGLLRTSTAASRSLAGDLHSRMRRELEKAQESVDGEIVRRVGSLRTWHLRLTDFGDKVEDMWGQEMNGLHTELDEVVRAEAERLVGRLEGVQVAAVEEWTNLPDHVWGFSDLQGFESVWGNRVARATLGMGRAALVLAGAKLGAEVGAALGVVTGPAAVVTSAVGAVVGGIAGLVMEPLKVTLESWFRGKAWVLGTRREQVGKQIGPILDTMQVKYGSAAQQHFAAVTQAVDEHFSDLRNEFAHRDAIVAAWTDDFNALTAEIDQLDLTTARALLHLDGRQRLARGLLAASRNPGVCTLATLTPGAASEGWLFPPSMPETLAVAAPPSAVPASQSLSYVLGLTEEVGTLRVADQHRAIVNLSTSHPPGVLGAWSDVLSHHTRAKVHVVNDGVVERTTP